ncbi:MAG: hypothetical protein Q8P05_02815 [Candidatus Diapherotrites archaeon]|nr:hypothetical protein [Candidatus Diapherotrites archaeon]
MTNPKDIQYYSAMEKELRHSQVEKAYKLLEHDCIEYDHVRKRFICKPIRGYNSTTYIFERIPKKIPIGESSISHECNCQGYQTKKRKGETPFCSHLLALHYWFNQRNKSKGWGKYRQ